VSLKVIEIIAILKSISVLGRVLANHRRQIDTSPTRITLYRNRQLPGLSNYKPRFD
jgi:hypothetical protein